MARKLWHYLPGLGKGVKQGTVDNESMCFGTDDDVSVKWDGSKLTILPLADDTGAICIGNGTKDIDLKVFLGTTGKYAEFDVGNSRINLQAVPIKFGGTLPSHPLNLEGIVLADNCNVIRGSSVNPTRTSGWTSFSGEVTDTPAQVYSDYRELHTKGVAEVLGFGSFPYMDSGAACASMFAGQFIAYVSSGAEVLASGGESIGIFPLWAKLVLDGPLTFHANGVAAALYADVQVNVTDLSSRNVANIHLHNASGVIRSAFYMNHEAGAVWTYLFYIEDADAPWHAGSVHDTDGAEIKSDGYLSIYANGKEHRIAAFDS